MKKILSTIIIVVCMVMNVNAITVDIDGIRYEIISTTDLTARVQGYASSELFNVVIPEYIDYYGKQFKVVEIGDKAFMGTEQNPSLLMHITLPQTLEKIGERAFEWSNVEELTIPDNVTDLGTSFAAETKQLKNVIIGKGVKRIPEHAFTSSNIESLEIPDNVIELGNTVINVALKLKRLVFGRGLQTIPRTTIYLSPVLEHVFLPNNLSSIHYTGIRSSNVKKMIIEDSDVILNIDIPKSETGTYSCGWIDENGTKVEISSISDKNCCLFASCNIQDLYLGRNMVVKTTSEELLPRVKNLTVGPKATDIRGLFNLDYMQSIMVKASTPPAFNRGVATEECYMRIKVYVPKGSLDAYKNHSEWGKYWNIEEYDDACEAPEISYEDSMLKVLPVTPGSICYYTISDNDIVTDKEMTGGVKLTGTYNIEAYAMLNGSKSERSFATLCWLNNTFTSTGFVQTTGEAKRPVIIKSRGREISIEGLNDGEDVDFYTLDGRHIGSISATGSYATFDTETESGAIIVVRIGNDSVKMMVR